MNLTFRELKASDSFLTENWVCTDPAKKKYNRYRGLYHPAIWELRAQSLIREIKLFKVARLPSEVALGAFYGQNLVGIIYLNFEKLHGGFHIAVISVAQGWHGRGVAQKLLKFAIGFVTNSQKFSYLTDEERTLFYCEVDDRNEKSVRAFEKFGFRKVGSSQSPLEDSVTFSTFAYRRIP